MGLRPWMTVTVEDASRFLADARFRWWVTGGQALELYIGTSWRSHVDLDIGFLRMEARDLWTFLAGLERYVFAAGSLRPWSGEPLVAGCGENNVWCRRAPDAPWFLDFTANDGDEGEWADQADPALRVGLDEAVLASATGVPFLAPHLTLLAKSREHRPKDDLDAAVVIPNLDVSRRSWLAGKLPVGHAWHSLLG